MVTYSVSVPPLGGLFCNPITIQMFSYQGWRCINPGDLLGDYFFIWTTRWSPILQTFCTQISLSSGWPILYTYRGYILYTNDLLWKPMTYFRCHFTGMTFSLRCMNTDHRFWTCGTVWGPILYIYHPVVYRSDQTNDNTIKTSDTVLRKIYLSLYLKGLRVRGNWRPNRTATYWPSLYWP